MTKVPRFENVVDSREFGLLILENPQISERFTRLTLMLYLVVEQSRQITLEYALSRRTLDFARRGSLDSRQFK